jgi:pimeloyl-ACP methyl ester carboxylesterase
MPLAHNGNVPLHYTTAGQGPAVILLSGVGYGGGYWQNVVPLLAPDATVLCMDNRGTDGSGKPDGPYSIQLMAQDTLAVLDHAGAKTALVVGHSMGGFVAQELALHHPDRVSAMLLMSTSHGGMRAVPPSFRALDIMTRRQGTFDELFSRALAASTAPTFAAAQPERVAQLRAYRAASTVPPECYRAQVMAGAGHNARERLMKLTLPVHILMGALDEVVPPQNGILLQSVMPHADLHVLGGVGHLLSWEAPDAFVAAVRALLPA